ncbi:MAG: iron-containing redox enzyme family protein, partial [Actinobacteria bacterium]|nr:iron-containing redox enzyme family protein [Actinomycetota bacterium]
MPLPTPRGPLSENLLMVLQHEPGDFRYPAGDVGDALTDEDLHLALYLCYELNYRGLPGVDDRWEWEPSLVGFRGVLERRFETALRDVLPHSFEGETIPEQLRIFANRESAHSLSRHIQSQATLGHFREFVIHRSAYHLKEADPHSWAIPRLTGKTKAALLEIQNDEYGSGSWRRMHSELFAAMMVSIGLDPAYGAYLDRIPGVTLASVNLMSLFGLNRRLRGALVGHLAMFEMTSTIPNKRYGDGLRRLSHEADTRFFDEHVEADAVHEQIAAHDLAGTLAAEEPHT